MRGPPSRAPPRSPGSNAHSGWRPVASPGTPPASWPRSLHQNRLGLRSVAHDPAVPVKHERPPAIVRIRVEDLLAAVTEVRHRGAVGAEQPGTELEHVEAAVILAGDVAGSAEVGPPGIDGFGFAPGVDAKSAAVGEVTRAVEKPMTADRGAPRAVELVVREPRTRRDPARVELEPGEILEQVGRATGIEDRGQHVDGAGVVEPE